MDEEYDSAVRFLHDFYRMDSARSSLDVVLEEDEDEEGASSAPRISRSQTHQCLASLVNSTTTSSELSRTPSSSWSHIHGQEHNIPQHSSAYVLRQALSRHQKFAQRRMGSL
jgi:hypothetical protein